MDIICTFAGLYHRAIMQSGGLFNPFWLWQTREDAVGLSSVLAMIYNCTDCLQEVDFKDLWVVSSLRQPPMRLLTLGLRPAKCLV